MTRTLLIVSALLELGAGAVLIASPSMAISLLLGAPLDTSVGTAVARVAGAALLSLGVACWFARRDGQSRAGRAVVAAMVIYDIAVAAVLAYSSFGSGLSGVGIWPAVALHALLAVWCFACLRRAGASSAK